MYVTNLDEVTSIIRSKLDEYLVSKGIKQLGPAWFNCFVHDDANPSMKLNPKTNYETVHCFGCGSNMDVFSAAEHLENLPSKGSEWVRETIPHLAKILKIPIALGTPDPQEVVRLRYLELARDIATVIQHPKNTSTTYMTSRKWTNDFEDCYSVDFKEVIDALTPKWSIQDITDTRMITLRGSEDSKDYPIIGKDKTTCIIKDQRGRPVAFISRSLDPAASWKYLHSAESPIYSKSNILYGLDLALETAKLRGLIIVEGVGDRFQFLRTKNKNVVALCGLALTEMHFSLLKSNGVKDLYLLLDWDPAGLKAIERIINTINEKSISGFNIFVIPPIEGFKDIDEYLFANPEANFNTLPSLEIFDWIISRTDLGSAEDITKKLITVIAACSTAIKRDMLANKLANRTGLSPAAILMDAERIRNHSFEERRERIIASAERYRANVEKDTHNITSAIALHESEVEAIDNEFGKDSVGVNYQLQRFDALQELKNDSSIDRTEFNLGTYTMFAAAMAKGIPWTTGAYFVFGGRANAAKTSVVLALALDAVTNDPDTIAIIHLTDDSYAFVEPRLVTNVSHILSNNQKLSIHAAISPKKGFASAEESALYNKTLTHIRGLITEERLIVLDQEDGSTLSTLEKVVKYTRRKYPHKKLLVVCDGLHNYSDFPHLDATPRIARITDMQKRIATKYACCVMTTAEYRKNMPSDASKMKYPVNDDLADARAIMFRATAIIHVYNDLNDRMDNAEIFWVDPNEPDSMKPRLLLLFGKNKHTAFKDKLIMDLDTTTVTIKQKGYHEAGAEAQHLLNSGFKVKNGLLIMDTDFEEKEKKDD